MAETIDIDDAGFAADTAADIKLFGKWCVVRVCVSLSIDRCDGIGRGGGCVCRSRVSGEGERGCCLARPRARRPASLALAGARRAGNCTTAAEVHVLVA